MKFTGICNVHPACILTVQCMLNTFFTELSGMCLFLRIAPLFLETGFSTEKSLDLYGRLRDSQSFFGSKIRHFRLAAFTLTIICICVCLVGTLHNQFRKTKQNTISAFFFCNSQTLFQLSMGENFSLTFTTNARVMSKSWDLIIFFWRKLKLFFLKKVWKNQASRD